MHSFDTGDSGGENMLSESLLAVNIGFLCNLPGKCQKKKKKAVLLEFMLQQY